ncbi:MAG: acetate/propionate family kinase [Actinomycetota bacterium]|nr:acetate/propionate family kinase [Actinomycetota bacterium]
MAHLMRVLVVNAGSSTVKLAVLDGDRVVGRETLDAPLGRPDETALARVIRRLAHGGIDATGHRVVHGGSRFTGPALVDDRVLAEIEAIGELAPLHQPPAVAALRITRGVLVDVPAVACFDTAFHARMSAGAATYAIPRRWREEFGIRRYGFHGLAHDWAAHRAAELVGRPVGELRIVVAHLGSGASACAVQGGRSVDTTMGFTPTAGLVMSTRCGDLDPAVPLWLIRHLGLDVAEVADVLDRSSGLLGLAGHADMPAVVAAADRGDPNATLAVDVWVHRVRGGLAAMAAAMGGLDVLVFSGGVGEHQPRLRCRVVAGMGFLGLALDTERNRMAQLDTEITTPGAAVRTLVVAAREDLVIARQVRRLLAECARPV